MTTVPETKYAKTGDIHIAYQVVGSGPRDVIMVPGSGEGDGPRGFAIPLFLTVMISPTRS